MATLNPLQFVNEVRGEVAKISWPTRRETLVTSAMVLVLASIAGLLFSTVDMIIRLGLQEILNFFGS